MGYNGLGIYFELEEIGINFFFSGFTALLVWP
jgi:hypothetical protein